LKLKNKEME